MTLSAPQRVRGTVVLSVRRYTCPRTRAAPVVRTRLRRCRPAVGPTSQVSLSAPSIYSVAVVVAGVSRSSKIWRQNLWRVKGDFTRVPQRRGKRLRLRHAFEAPHRERLGATERQAVDGPPDQGSPRSSGHD